MDDRKILPSGYAEVLDNTTIRPIGIKKILKEKCPHFHELQSYCCRFHEACLTGRPRFYKGFGLSPCVRQEHEPDPVVFPIRRRMWWQ